jgi:hypothetical protein
MILRCAKSNLNNCHSIYTVSVYTGVAVERGQYLYYRTPAKYLPGLFILSIACVRVQFPQFQPENAQIVI